MYCRRPSPKETGIKKDQAADTKSAAWFLFVCAKTCAKNTKNRARAPNVRQIQKNGPKSGRQKKEKNPDFLRKIKGFSMELLAGLEPATC